MKTFSRIFCTAFVFVIILSNTLFAQRNFWVPAASLASSASDEKLSVALTGVPVKNMNITADGTGGMIMCWSTVSSGTYSVNAQRVDAAGNPIWTAGDSGVTVAITGTDQMRPAQCISDGAGGAYIGWSGADPVSGAEEQFIQYINAAGQLMWGQSGMTLTPAQSLAVSASENANIIQMDNDGSGGVVVAFYSYLTDERNGTLNVMRLTAGSDGAAVTVWGPVSVLQHASGQLFVNVADPVIASDGIGGAYIGGVISDADTVFHASMAYVNSGGGVVFDAQFTSSISAINAGDGFQIAADNNGAVLAFVLASDTSNTYFNQSVAIRVSTGGALLWGPTVMHNSTDQNQINTRIAADGNGGIFAVLYDGAKFNGMYLQHIDLNGNVLWNATNSPAGISLDGVGASYAQLINDGQGNAICTWSKAGSINVQKFSAYGLPLWSVPVISGVGTYPEMAADNSGGAFIGWNVATTSIDVNAQHVAVGAIAGVPQLTVTDSLTFTATAFNRDSTSLPLYIFNNGIGNLNLSASTIISGLNAAEFFIPPGQLPASVAAGTVDTLWISFMPRDSAGPRTATLQLVSNDTTSPTFNVNLSGTSIGVPILLSSTYIDAGHIEIGSLDTVGFTITNAAQATAPLIIQSLSIDGSFAGDYQILNSIIFPDTLAAGQTLNVSVVFDALQGGPLPADLRVIANSASPVESVPIIGFGLKSSMSALPQDIGKVDLEHCKTFSLPVSNDGTAEMHLASFRFVGAHPEEFQYLGLPNVVIGAGDVGLLQLQFCPVNNGPQHAIAQLISTDNDTLLVDIRGWGGLGGALQSVSKIDWGTVGQNEAQTQSIEVVNVSDIPTTILSSAITGMLPAPFTAAIATPYTLAPGDSIQVPVKFIAAAAGTFVDTLVMQSSDQVPCDILFLGTVVSHPLSSTPDALFSDTIAVGQTETGVVVIKNITSVPQVIENVMLRGTDANAYAVTSSIVTPVTIAPNATDTIALAFTPNDRTATRAYLATLGIIDAAGDTVNVTFHGTGFVQITSVAGSSPAPNDFILGQNYPNPFASSTNIMFTLPTSGDVAIVVFDLLGREVQRVAEGVRSAGTYVNAFSGVQLPAGMYTYELRVNGIAMRHMLMQIAR